MPCVHPHELDRLADDGCPHIGHDLLNEEAPENFPEIDELYDDGKSFGGEG